MIVEIKKLNNILSTNSSQKEKLLAIVKFIMKSFIIHPFYDGNGKVFWLLNDLFLLKINFFPIFGNKDIEKIHKDVFAYYIIDFNKDLLLKKYLEFIISRYKNYKF